MDYILSSSSPTTKRLTRPRPIEPGCEKRQHHLFLCNKRGATEIASYAMMVSFSVRVDHNTDHIAPCNNAIEEAVSIGREGVLLPEPKNKIHAEFFFLFALHATVQINANEEFDDEIERTLQPMYWLDAEYQTTRRSQKGDHKKFDASHATLRCKITMACLVRHMWVFFRGAGKGGLATPT